ncbi:MAG: DUF255 domain-containing protein [Deferribacterales bacterium]
MKKVLNSLNKENSLYLLEHADNPVQWISWKDYRSLSNIDKPLFISIGYSSCHWCHVMANESFSDTETADFLNEHFISIKIDREEYPDLDKKYQLFAQLTGNNGGWPLTIFADKNASPFYAGTYFPKEQRYNLPSFLNILKFIIQIYQKNYDKVKKVSDDFNGILQKFYNQDEVRDHPNILNGYKKIFDQANGGLGNNQKFPNIPVLNYLANFADTDEELYNFLIKTADALSLSGIFDHIDGGFFRYTVDNQWNIPHFEKMLYDNAQNLSFLAKIYNLTENSIYLLTARKTADFLLNHFLTENGFGSSFNADSPDYDDIQKEGFYYLLDEQIISILTPQEADILSRYTYFNENHIRLIPDIDYPNFLLLQPIMEKLNSSRRKIKKQPKFDSKVIFSLNMLTLSALIDFYEISSDDHIITKILDIYQLLIDSMTKNNKIYRIRYQNKLFDHHTLEDYVYPIQVSRKLYEITKDKNFLKIIKNFLSSISKFFVKDKNIYYNIDMDIIDFMDDAAFSSLGLLSYELIKLSDFMRIEEFDIDYLFNYLLKFHYNYPLATPTIGLFLHEYKIKKEAL